MKRRGEEEREEDRGNKSRERAGWQRHEEVRGGEETGGMHGH